jgi:hypothetical protein
MAQRYGGKHSPGGHNPAGRADRAAGHPGAPARRTRVGMRVNLLFLAPAPLV